MTTTREMFAAERAEIDAWEALYRAIRTLESVDVTISDVIDVLISKRAEWEADDENRHQEDTR